MAIKVNGKFFKRIQRARQTVSAWKIAARAFSSPKAAKGYWFSGFVNFGDLLTELYLSERLGLPVVNVHGTYLDLGPALCGVGSLLQSLSYPNVTVWGSGFICDPISPPTASPRAVLSYRGPKSAEVAARLGWPSAPSYGDPGVLVSKIYEPETVSNRIGIIPHFSHYELMREQLSMSASIKLISVEQSVDKVVKELTSCETIISSSLHGIIVAEAFGIPTVWIESSPSLRGGRFKFDDYFASYGAIRNPEKLKSTMNLSNQLRSMSLDAVEVDSARIKEQQRHLDDLLTDYLAELGFYPVSADG